MIDQKNDLLKLVALDNEDLEVISAYLQDAVMLVGDLKFLPKEKRFVVVANRFVWHKDDQKHGKDIHERRRTALHFEKVEKVQMLNIKQNAADAVLNLLAIQFLPDDAPSGTVDLIFSGNGVLRLYVEAIEVQLCDMGGAWQTRLMPDHGPDNEADDKLKDK